MVLQERVLWLTTIKNDQVSDCFNGCLAAASVCMTKANGENRRYVGCERTPDEMKKHKPHLLVDCAKQVVLGFTVQRPSL